MGEILKRTRSIGFTVIELLIVIAVIGILATVILVGYNGVQNAAHDNAFKSDLQSIADVIKLKALDDNYIPAGGATSSLGGDSTVFPGVVIAPNTSEYDLTISNLFYCAGNINGIREFAIFAKGKTGKIFYYRSDQGLKELSGNPTLSYSVCETIGFSAPYTWSYGYNPGDQYKWFAWANAKGQTITNLVPNPSAETSAGWLSNNPAVYPITFTTDVKRGQTRSAVSSNVGTSVNLLSGYAPGSVEGYLPITETGTYTASIYFRAEVEAQARLTGSSYVAGSWTTSTFGDYVALPANQWVKVTYVYEVPASATRLRIGMRVDALSAQPAGTKAYADDAIITKGSDSWQYRDGTYGWSGWSWTGTANASTSQGPGQL